MIFALLFAYSIFHPLKNYSSKNPSFFLPKNTCVLWECGWIVLVLKVDFFQIICSYLLSIKWGWLIELYIPSISGRSRTILNKPRPTSSRRMSLSSSLCRTFSKNYILGILNNTKNCKNKPTELITSSELHPPLLAPSQIISIRDPSTTGRTTCAPPSKPSLSPTRYPREITEALWII